MYYCVCKKDKVGIQFCQTIVDEYNTSNSYDESIIQTISNNKYLVFYNSNLMRRNYYLKIVFEEELSNCENITVDYLENKIIPLLVDCLRSCYRLKYFSGNRMYGNIVILTQDEIYVITSGLDDEKMNSYYSDNALIPFNDELGNPAVLDLVEKRIQVAINNRMGIDYPIVYGNSIDSLFHLKYEYKTIDASKEK